MGNIHISVHNISLILFIIIFYYYYDVEHDTIMM